MRHEIPAEAVFAAEDLDSAARAASQAKWVARSTASVADLAVLGWH
jgi:hypothetical protein